MDHDSEMDKNVFTLGWHAWGPLEKKGFKTISDERNSKFVLKMN